MPGLKRHEPGLCGQAQQRDQESKEEWAVSHEGPWPLACSGLSENVAKCRTRTREDCVNKVNTVNKIMAKCRPRTREDWFAEIHQSISASAGPIALA